MGAVMLHIVLFEPEIPYNTGSVGRTCVALGAKLWLVRPLGFQLSDKQLRRAGLDYWQHLDYEVVDDWAQLRERLGGVPMWYFTKTAKREYTNVEYEAETALVFGSESRGLPPSLLRQAADRKLRIPIHVKARSLNLSVSVAVTAFEVRRQQTVDGKSCSHKV